MVSVYRVTPVLRLSPPAAYPAPAADGGLSAAAPRRVCLLGRRGPPQAPAAEAQGGRRCRNGNWSDPPHEGSVGGTGISLVPPAGRSRPPGVRWWRDRPH